MSDSPTDPFETRESDSFPDERSAIAECVRKFRDAWNVAQKNGPPNLYEFLPADSRFRQNCLCELIRCDLGFRYRRFRFPKRLEEYCEEFSELDPSSLPAELIIEEYACRVSAGESVRPGEYFYKYPVQAKANEELFALHSHELASRATEFPTIDHISIGVDEHATIGNPNASLMSIEDLQAGQQVDDFDLIMPLGKGAFARVFLARQRSMQRFVAVKISADHGSEPQTLAQLDHDYIVRVYDQRSVHRPPSQLLYMQYLPGGTLEAIIGRVNETPCDRRSGRLLADVLDEALFAKGEIPPSDSSLRAELNAKSWPEVVAWLGGRIARGLDYAHRQGVLHRDLKPANILLTAEGVPKLADFNISFSSQVAGADAAKNFGGSLAYMSPEQLEAFLPTHSRQASDLDERSDLYSLGMVLWQLLTGKRPFVETSSGGTLSDTVEELLEQQLRGVSEDRIVELRESVPETLVRILKRLLEADREARWQSAEQVAEHLEICLEPRAGELIDPPPQGWRACARRYVVSTVLLLNLIPNLISAVSNFLYNDAAIFRELAPGMTFEYLIAAINGTAFPTGIAFIIWSSLKIRRRIAEPESASTNPLMSHDALFLGHRCALICLLLWALAGFTYPVAFQLIGFEVSAADYVHIFGSLVVFGLFATTYPFFGVTWYAVQILYPALMKSQGQSEEDRQELHQLKHLLRLYLFAAAGIPMLAIAAITIVAVELLWVAQMLCFGGFAAFGAAFWLYRRTEDDIDVFLKLGSHGELD